MDGRQVFFMGKRVSTKRIGRRTGNLLIVLGSLALFYFLWLNYSGTVYRIWYDWAWEHYLKEEVEAGGDFSTIDDLPSALFLGRDLIGSDADPGLAGPDGAPEEDADASGSGGEETEAILPITYTERADYQDGDMTLVVPRMGVRCRVMDGTSQAKLKKGPGLYDVSDLPAEADTNVVIAGHRNVYGSWFYNIDKMEPGEKIVLLFGDREYIYECEKIEIIEPNDWSVTERRGYAAITLTSCEPKNGRATRRIIAAGKLVEVRQRTAA